MDDGLLSARYRCRQCGNLTRFDVRTTRTTQAYHHYSIGGELQIEDERVLAETVEEIRCRWCDSPRSVERINHDPSLSPISDVDVSS